MDKYNYLSAFERGMVVDTKCTSLRESRTATLLGISHTTLSHWYQEVSNTQRASSQLWEALESGFRHQIETVLRAKEGVTQHSEGVPNV